MLDTGRRPFSAALFLGLIHAVLFGAAFPPLNLWPLALLAPWPLIHAAARTPRPLRAGLGAALGVAPMWAFHHQYTWAMTEAAFLPLSCYLALYDGLFVWAIARLRSRRPRLPIYVTAPILWTTLEVLRGEVVFDGYAQYLLAHPLIDRLIALAAPYVGVYPIAFFVVLLPALLFDRAPQRAPSRALAALSIAAALFALCILPRPSAPSSEGTRRVTLAAVQTNVPQDNRTSLTIDERIANFHAFSELTRTASAAPNKPALIAWPEAMVPALALNADAIAIERAAGFAYPGNIPTTLFHDALIQLQSEVGVPLLVGGQAVEGLRISTPPNAPVDVSQDALFNSAFLVRQGAVEPDRYDKMQLMPFGEVMPYISNWDWLEKQLLAIGGRGLTFDLTPGADVRTFTLALNNTEPPLRIAAPICFESVFARQMRRLINDQGRRRADLFVNISNDGWFAWYDAGRANLVLQSRWRSLELATPMLRSVNTGISAAIDHQGNLIHAGPTDPTGTPLARVPGVLIADFDVSPRNLTIYAKVGDVAAWTLFAVGLLFTLSTFMPNRHAPNRNT